MKNGRTRENIKIFWKKKRRCMAEEKWRSIKEEKLTDPKSKRRLIGHVTRTSESRLTRKIFNYTTKWTEKLENEWWKPESIRQTSRIRRYSIELRIEDSLGLRETQVKRPLDRRKGGGSSAKQRRNSVRGKNDLSSLLIFHDLQ